MAGQFWKWQQHRSNSLPPEEAAWEQSFGVITENRMSRVAHYRKTWAFRIRYWFKRKFVWRG